jgi:hypothetical protein
MNQLALKKYVEDNPSVVTMRESLSHPGLFVLKYKKKVFYDNLWDEYLEECRGTIVDSDFNIVTYPFTKIYNFRIEDSAPILADDVKVTAYRKVNGFMCAATWYNGDVLISTTGSTDSPFVAYAKEMIGDNIGRYRSVCESAPNVTLMFEVCHPADPHIVNELPGMYLLGARKNQFGSKIDADSTDLTFCAELLNAYAITPIMTTVGELVAMSKIAKHEGFVAYTEDGQAFKIKSPYYLTAKWIARNPRTDKLLTKAFKEQIDEEYYPLLDYIRNNIEPFTVMDEQARLIYIRKFLEKQ